MWEAADEVKFKDVAAGQREVFETCFGVKLDSLYLVMGGVI